MKMPKYAEHTQVSSAQSRAEIEHTLSRYGATGFMYGWQADKALVGFQMRGKQIKFVLHLPDKNDREFTHTPSRGQRRSPEQQEAAYEQAVRQRWRALALVIKAKLEAVEAGITVFEDEFLAHIVLPDGRTVGEYMLPQIEESYSSGRMPALLPQLMGGASCDRSETGPGG
jgi:hypothetical protein